MSGTSALSIKAYLIADNYGNVWAMRSTVASAMKKAEELHSKHPQIRFRIHLVTETRIIKQEELH